ncbi:hypothetical protein GGTG_10604 [Gaeumannomyces tritici R3-111a-1]|uniref:Uncharacterized protein n=1 Tax=Gaeumannomyces tritici (strain R3-111a-1) TaxID=644352 RepID=J3PAS9_GAET3|nr:hypothetical protein GGTG_10604 [Gaeumannomyces tritici R3-111a-1]EJT71345.1 hypothetical protein GGTG_10604 [Gaeumannomyces tritici R3-111a-1]
MAPARGGEGEMQAAKLLVVWVPAASRGCYYFRRRPRNGKHRVWQYCQAASAQAVPGTLLLPASPSGGWHGGGNGSGTVEKQRVRG